MYTNVFTEESRIDNDLNDVLFDGKICKHFLEVPFEIVQSINHLQFCTNLHRNVEKLRFTFGSNSIKVTTFYKNSIGGYERYMTFISEGYSYYLPKKTIELDFDELNRFKLKMNDNLFGIWFSTKVNNEDDTKYDIMVTLRLRESINDRHTFKITEVKRKQSN